eukprot:COSAG01_NODE_1260_length_11008_cov_96.487208_8_plen_83_part_00
MYNILPSPDLYFTQRRSTPPSLLSIATHRALFYLYKLGNRSFRACIRPGFPADGYLALLDEAESFFISDIRQADPVFLFGNF